MKRYIFIFATGYGIGEVSSHTVKTYPINIKADNDVEAIKKISRTRLSKSRYNSCFSASVFAVCVDNKYGICFEDYSTIKWEEDYVLRSPQVFGPPPYKWQISKPKYLNEWICNYIFNPCYPSFKAYQDYVFEYMNHPAFGETAEQRLNKYYYPLLQMQDPLAC